MNCLHEHLEKAHADFQAASLKAYIEGIYGSDHWPSFKVFHKTANWIADTLNALDGVKARVIEFPADGETMYGDWVMPMAWDADSAILKDLATGEVLVDYEQVPTAMVMGSGATPRDGIQAELVYLDSPADLESVAIDGKIILTGFNPQGIKKDVVARGAVALIFATHIADDMNDAVRWVNSWSDDPAMWSMTKSDTECPALSLSINQSEQLKQRLESGEKVELDINIQTRSYEGTLPVVEAFIAGEEQEEVFITGHLYEQGANDNASGGATMMEIVRMFAGSKPKKGIRVLFTSEIYGTVPYCHENKEVLKNCIAGINIDSTAEVGRKSQKMDIIENPITNPSFVNILMRELVEATGRSDQYAYQSFLLDDNLVTDPDVDIPCVLVGVCSKNWHTSFDTLDIIDWDLFNSTTELCAAWVSVVANGGQAEAELLKASTESFLATWQSAIEEKESDAGAEQYRSAFIEESKASFRNSINAIHPVYDAASAAADDENGLQRVYFACPSLSQMPVDKRQALGLNMWSGNAYYPLFFANGKRSAEKIAAYMHYGFNAAYDRSLRTVNGYLETGYLR